jgi:hypothetical protein
MGVNNYWNSLSTTASELSDLALLRWCSPTNGAGPERAYSIVTHMDLPGNSTMGLKTFTNTVKLRFNGRIVHVLGDELLADRLVETAHAPAPRHLKRSREEVAATDAAEKSLKKARLEAVVTAKSAEAAAAAATAAAAKAELEAASESE